GPADQDYLSRIDQAIAAAGCAAHVHLAGAAYGEERCAAYRSADAFVLPSLSEGLPMAALEAFSSGLPALLTPQCNLPAAFSCGGAIATDPDESAIADGIARLFAMSDAERTAMGRRARDFAMATFDWNVVAEGFADL